MIQYALRAGWRGILGLGLGFGLLLPSLSAEAARYAALSIEGPGALALAADPRFEAADQSTVEFSLAVAGIQPEAAADPSGWSTLCIAEHGDSDDLSWRISLRMKDDDDVLRFSRADGSHVDVSFSLRGTGYHHFAFISAGGRMQAMLNGEPMQDFDLDGLPAPGVEFTYRRPTPEGLPLTFGCAGGPAARAWISSFRIWGAALSGLAINYVRGFTGPVTPRADVDGKLLAYALFTDETKEVRLATPRIRFTEFKGAEGGTPFFYRRPPGQELRAIYVWPGNFLLSDIGVEFDGPNRHWDLTDGETWGDLTLPTILPRRTTTEFGERAAYAAALLQSISIGATSPPVNDDAEQFRRLRALLTGNRMAERYRAFGVNTTMLGQLDFTDSGIRGFSIPLLTGHRFGSIIASYGSNALRAMSFGTNGFTKSDFIGYGEGRQDVFNLELPPGTRLEGIAGRRGDDGTLRALALAYSEIDDSVPPSLAGRVTEGVWVEEGAVAPVRDPGARADTEAEAFDGTYGDQTIYSFRSDYGGNLLQLIVDATSDSVVPPVGFRRHNFVQRTGNEWVGIPSETGEFATDGDTLWFFDDHVRWGKNDDPNGGGIVLVRPAPYPAGDAENKLPWGATFSLEHRPNGVIANFKGYRPSLMQAQDFQATTGAGKLVFRMPEDTSADYVATDSRLIVPHGLIFSLDSKGSEVSDGVKLDTSIERQSSWSLGVGAKIGIPLVANFSEDGSHQESQETVHDESLSMVQNRAIVSHYALVLDRGRMRLSDEFHDAIIKMRDRMEAGLPIDWATFFADFGTHYPYAVTYGGMAWSETTIQQSQTKVATSSDDKISASASGFLEDALEVGVNANSEYSQGSKHSEGYSRDRTNYGTYGGSFSTGGGWSVGRGEEVPVLLDLRPITELLTPAFFEDEAIYRGLRHQMLVEFNKHHADIAQAMADREASWALKLARERCPFGELCNMGTGLYP